MIKQLIVELLTEHPLLTNAEIFSYFSNSYPEILVGAAVNEMIDDGILYKTISGGVIVSRSKVSRYK